MKRMFAAGIDQGRGVPSQWDDGWSGYSERFASREGQFITANSVAAAGKRRAAIRAALRSMPMFRILAADAPCDRAEFLTYNQSEGELRPQWALYTGAFGGGVISTAWKPPPRNAFAEGGCAMLGQAGYGALLEFLYRVCRGHQPQNRGSEESGGTVQTLGTSS